MKINYNISAMIANNNLNASDRALSNSIERLTSGFKINHAKDDASGLAMSRRMNAQIRSLETANQNSNDGISVIEIAEGALSEIQDMVQRMNELAVKASNGTVSDDDRVMINDEIKQLKEEIEKSRNRDALRNLDARARGVAKSIKAKDKADAKAAKKSGR